MATGEHCKHYLGRDMFMGKPCAAGIDAVYSYCDNERTGWVKRAPCFKSNVGAAPCHMASFPTPEEVKAANDAFEAQMADFLAWTPLARNRILEIAQETNQASGAIDCPKCAQPKSLHWTRARSNGHVHAQCETKDCLGWME